MHICMQNTTTQLWRATQFLEKYTSHFIWKGCVWEGVGDRIELQHIDPHSIGHNCVSFLFSWAAQLGAWGPTLLDAGFLYRILSPTGRVSKLTDFLFSPSYIIVPRPLLLVGITIALIQPIHGQGYNSDIPRPDAPVIYIGAFPILTAQPGRRSIYNINKVPKNLENKQVELEIRGRIKTIETTTRKLWRVLEIWNLLLLSLLWKTISYNRCEKTR